MAMKFGQRDLDRIPPGLFFRRDFQLPAPGGVHRRRMPGAV